MGLVVFSCPAVLAALVIRALLERLKESWDFVLEPIKALGVAASETVRKAVVVVKADVDFRCCKKRSLVSL